jgi:hypothetical protein
MLECELHLPHSYVPFHEISIVVKSEAMRLLAQYRDFIHRGQCMKACLQRLFRLRKRK